MLTGRLWELEFEIDSEALNVNETVNKKRITLFKRKDSFPVVSIACLYDPYYQCMLYDSWFYELAALYLVLYAIIAHEFNINQCWDIFKEFMN